MEETKLHRNKVLILNKSITSYKETKLKENITEYWEWWSRKFDVDTAGDNIRMVITWSTDWSTAEPSVAILWIKIQSILFHFVS